MLYNRFHPERLDNLEIPLHCTDSRCIVSNAVKHHHGITKPVMLHSRSHVRLSVSVCALGFTLCLCLLPKVIWDRLQLPLTLNIISCTENGGIEDAISP